MFFNKLSKLKYLFLALFVAGFLFVSLKSDIKPVYATSSHNIRGWFWSENVGWLSANCYNDNDGDGEWEDSCSNTNYGLHYNSSNKTISGYAWSEHIGWVCFGSSCDGTAPDGQAPWACYGPKSESGPTCLGDYEEDFQSTANLVGQWKFNIVNEDGETPDSSGNGYTGILKPDYSNNNAPVQADGFFSNSLEFDGIDDYVSNTHASFTNAITIEAWIYPTTLSLPNNHRMIYTSGNTATYLSLYTNNYAYPFVSLNIEGNQRTLNSGYRPTANNWYHVAVTWDGTGDGYIRIYVNGELKNTSSSAYTGSLNVGTSGSTKYIGRYISSGYEFQGRIDNLAIYSRAKTAQEIWDDAHREISGWAKIVSLGDDGWIKLKGQTTTDKWWGMSLEPYNDFYIISGYGWDDFTGTGWFKGGYSSSNTADSPHTPLDFDNLTLNNSYGCQQMYVQWEPSKWAKWYKYFRCDEVEKSECSNCSYTERWVLAGSCGASECSMTDIANLTANTGYCYKIKAYNKSGSTWNSDGPEWGKTTLCAPGGLTPSSTACGTITLNWSYNTNADGYNIYRALSSTGCDDLGASTCELVGHGGEAISYVNLVGQWKMNESLWNGTSGEVKDSSGNGNNGTAVGNANTTGNGKHKRAGNFDGDGDYVTIPHASITNAITIEAWVYPTTINSQLSYRAIYGAAQQYTFLAIKVINSSPVLSLYINGTQRMLDSNYTLSLNNWYHITGTWDSSTGQMKIYVNGELKNTSASYAGTLDVGSYSKYIAHSLYDSADFAGRIDNLAIYSRAKTAEEIRKDYESFILASGCEDGGNCTYNDQRVLPNVNYYYRLTATTEYGESPASTVSSDAKTICLPPAEIEEK